MAVGDVLNEPLTGFTRIDERDNNITFTEKGTQSTNEYFYNKTYTILPINASIMFNFVGTAFKVIGTYAKTLHVYIDSKKYVVVESGNPGTAKSILVEFDGLKDTEHSVVITNIDSSSSNTRIDAIDIQGGTTLLPYNDKSPLDKILLLSNNETYSIEKGGNKTNNAIPLMTSNTSPSGKASASDIHATSYDAWKAFDGSLSSASPYYFWNSGNYKTYPIWIQYEFEKPIIIGKYDITGHNVSYLPKDWILQGSNNGVDFVDLDTQSVVSSNWKVNTPKEFEINNTNKYKIYRLLISSSNSSVATYITEIRMYEKEPNSLKVIPSHSEQNFINYGINSPIQLDGLFENKNYILQNTVSEDIDGLWKTQITRKPLSISLN